MIRNYLLWLASSSAEHNRRNIIDLLEENTGARLLDLGCDDGEFTGLLGRKIQTRRVTGIEINEPKAMLAKSRGIDVVNSDLNSIFPFDDKSFDIVHSNQVIEHILNLDGFIKEIFRVTKPGGYAIISTENLASWHNILSLLFGWQPFSITNYLPGKNLGNPLSLHMEASSEGSSWCHDKLWAYNGLRDCFQSYGFVIKAIRGAGYHPFPSFLGDLDKRHCHWITFKLLRPA